jgi:hypothetical protein
MNGRDAAVAEAEVKNERREIFMNEPFPVAKP